jgi:LemA protein
MSWPGQKTASTTPAPQFNDTIKGYNLKVRSFPSNIIASLFGFKDKQPFTASEAEKTTPKVEF